MTRPGRCKPRSSGACAARVRVEHPLFLLFAAAVLLGLDGSGLLRLGLLCAALHEAGHIAAYRLLLRRWPAVTVSPGGLRIPLRGVWLSARQELCLAAAGPLANLLLCLAAHGWMAWRGAAYAGYWFAAVNLLVGGANLLPLPGLDGARILRCVFCGAHCNSQKNPVQ